MFNQNAIYQINGVDLMQFAQELISSTKKELEAEILSQKTERYITTSEVCQILSIDPTTCWRHCKRGYLTPLYIGGKKRFKLSEITKIAQGKC